MIMHSEWRRKKPRRKTPQGAMFCDSARSNRNSFSCKLTTYDPSGGYENGHTPKLRVYGRSGDDGLGALPKNRAKRLKRLQGLNLQARDWEEWAAPDATRRKTKDRFYCKDWKGKTKKKGAYPNVTLDFLGYQFRPRVLVRKTRETGKLFCKFHPGGFSPSAL